MGFCCSANISDPEIEDAQTIHELIVILNNRKIALPIEKKEIEDYLEDPNKEIKSVGIENIDNESLKKRIPFFSSKARLNINRQTEAHSLYFQGL